MVALMTPRLCNNPNLIVITWVTNFDVVLLSLTDDAFKVQGAVLVKNLAAKEPSALGLDSYYKQYYLCLAAAAATIKWYFF